MNTSNIPFLDLVTPHRELQEELIATFRRALDAGSFVGGPAVEGFEREFAQFCEVPYCVGVGSGTDALRFALLAAGIGNGDIVVTVPNTFIATTEAITQTGAMPSFVDIDERTYNMDPARLEEYLECRCRVNDVTGALQDRATGRRVTAIVPVHLYGQMADMDPIMEQAARYRLRVIEDACQAHGAMYHSKLDDRWYKAGSMGIAAAFSFYPGKNLGACGEAGAVTTGDADLARKVKMLRDHGQAAKYNHDIEGYNGRLDAVQAGLLSVKLRYLPEWNAQRRQVAARYAELFANSGAAIITPYEPHWSIAVYHLYVIRCAGRDALREALAKQRIGTGVHYPIALHRQKAYASHGYNPGSFPTAETAAAEVLSLPMFPTLTAEQQEFIGAQILEQVCQVAWNT